MLGTVSRISSPVQGVVIRRCCNFPLSNVDR